MSDHRDQWIEIPPHVAQAGRRSAEWGVSPVAAQLLASRGWLDASGRLRTGWDGADAPSSDPFDLPDMEIAVDRVARALSQGERIVVHGDYDADGISGTALLCSGLRALGAEVAPFVPDRIRDGYGVADRLVEHCGERGVGVLITVDTGSSAHAALARARELGVDVLVCDHHLVDETPAPAAALLNAQRPQGSAEQRVLCGCAVAYKLLCALHTRLGLDEPVEQLDLVALATVADQVPLRGENRRLVREGIARLSARPRPGLAALLEITRLRGIDFDEGDLAFQLAPRINAAGRVERPRTALDLLLCDDSGEARRLAARCDDLNRQRKSIQQRVSASATVHAERLLAASAPAGLVLADAAWHFGVVGISAAHVADRFGVPAVLLAVDGELARGSARSAAGVDLKRALDACSDLLLRHGGHAAAAGLLMETAQIEAFRERFAQAVAAQPTAGAPRGIRVDAEAQLAEIDLDLVGFLRRLGPFGAENPRPRLVSRALEVESVREVGSDHLRLRLRDADQSREFIGFSLFEVWARQSLDSQLVDVIYSVGYREGTPFDPWQLQLHGFRAHRPRAAAAAKEEA